MITWRRRPNWRDSRRRWRLASRRVEPLTPVTSSLLVPSDAPRGARTRVTEPSESSTSSMSSSPRRRRRRRLLETLPFSSSSSSSRCAARSASRSWAASRRRAFCASAARRISSGSGARNSSEAPGPKAPKSSCVGGWVLSCAEPSSSDAVFSAEASVAFSAAAPSFSAVSVFWDPVSWPAAASSSAWLAAVASLVSSAAFSAAGSGAAGASPASTAAAVAIAWLVPSTGVTVASGVCAVVSCSGSMCSCAPARGTVRTRARGVLGRSSRCSPRGRRKSVSYPRARPVGRAVREPADARVARSVGPRT